MKEIHVNEIIDSVKVIVQSANMDLGQDVQKALEESLEVEETSLGKYVINQIIDNIEIAREENVPLCQDTGIAVFFIEIGQDVHVIGGSLNDAINEGVRQGYKEGYLRKSVVGDPLLRKNTGDNTPAVIHIDVVEGTNLKITMAPKGAGSENMSFIKMLKPSDGIEGVKEFVLESVKSAGANPCPPIVVGIGIGGTFEKAATIAKKSLFRNIGIRNSNEHLALLELDILKKINELGIGPQGFGGKVTALDVHIETYPTHIASLPVAINLNCHACRHKEIIL